MAAPMPRDFIRSLIFKWMNMRLELTHDGKNDRAADAEAQITVA
jgi:hypothetical protein